MPCDYLYHQNTDTTDRQGRNIERRQPKTESVSPVGKQITGTAVLAPCRPSRTGPKHPTRGRKKHQASGTAITARRDHSASRAAGAYPDTPATPGSVLRGDGGDEGGRGVAAISTSTASSAAGTTGSVFHSPSPTWLGFGLGFGFGFVFGFGF